MKKYSKKLISIILSLVTLFSVFITSSSAAYTYNTQVEALMLEAIKNRENSVDISSAVDIPSFATNDVFIPFITEFTFRHPEYFYYDPSDTKFYSSGIMELPYLEHTTEQIDNFNKKLDEIVALAQGMSDLDKVIFFHEYIMENCDYDYSYENSSAYDCLMNHTCVCEGYTKAFLCLCRRVNIECSIVTSPLNEHAWSLVKLDGKWYYFDVTHDDTLGKKHINLLSSGDQCEAQSHKVGVYPNGELGDWKIFGNENCTKTFNNKEFDNAFWKTATNIMNYCDGKWYYTDGLDIFAGQYPAAPIKLTNHEKNKYLWFVFDDTRLYYGNYVDVVEASKRLYYSTPTEIRCMNLDGTNDCLVYTLSEYEKSKGFIYDLKAEGEKIFFYLSKDPSFDVTYSSYIDAHVHSLSQWTVLRNPTCTQEGEKERFCQEYGCGYVEREKIEKTSHIYTNWDREILPTCTQEGMKIRLCSKCGNEEIHSVTAVGHSYSEWELQPDGTYTRLCSVCNETEIRTDTPENLKYHIGDANCDGKINSKDACAILKHVAKLENLSPLGLKAADVDKNEKISLKDAQIILRFVAKLISML